MRSIKFRYAASIFVLIASLVIFVDLYFPAQQRKQYVEAYENELAVISETLGLGLAIGLRDDNYESLQFVFDFARSDERFVFVLVKDAENQTIASYPEGLELSEADLAGNLFKGDDVLINKSGIEIGDQVFGEIYMAYSLRQLNDLITQSRNQTLIIGALILMLGLVLAYVVAIRLTRPIELLTKATRALKEGDYTVRANVSTRDETGILATNFNEMARTIAGKTDELEARAEELTESVAALEKAKDDIQKAHRETEQLLSSISSVVIGVDQAGIVRRWNIVAAQLFELSEEHVLGQPLRVLDEKWSLGSLENHFKEGMNHEFTMVDDVKYETREGRAGFLNVTINIVRDADAKAQGYLILAADITEKKNLESQLSQAQKLESLGQLAAGVAHEINTPIQYIGDNTRFLEVAFKRLDSVLGKSQELVESFKEGAVLDTLISEVEQSIAASKMAYMREEIPFAIEESLVGVTQVASIVQSMKLFSHPGTKEKDLNDINAALESTLNVARNEWKYVADVVTEFDPDLPKVPSLQSELNQVFLNLIVNAAHAITPIIKDKPNQKGTITVSTSVVDRFAEIRIRDNGTGIPEKIQAKVFDLFFTTKEVGKGTGQGLAVAHNVVTEKHGGVITLESEEGVGTVFIIKLPLEEAEVSQQ
ncbi:MAG: ATP-binding protein [Bacteroidota bacterium]